MPRLRTRETSIDRRPMRRRGRRPFLLEFLEQRRLLAAIEVTTVQDVVDANDGVISLREAIDQANADVDPDTITFSPLLGETHTIELTKTSGVDLENNVNGDLDLFTGEITIQGRGQEKTIISGGGDSGINERVFHLLGSASVTIKDLTVRGGRAPFGAGIAAQGQLTSLVRLENLLVTDNVSIANAAGILIGSAGRVELTNSLITGNVAGDSGGGLSSFSELSIRRTTIVDNEATNLGGGVHVQDPTANVSIDDSTIAGNTSGFGGGLATLNATTNVTNTTLSGNTATVGAGAVINIASGIGSVSNTRFVNSTITLNQTANAGNVNAVSQDDAVSSTIEFGNTILVENTRNGTLANVSSRRINGGSGEQLTSLGNNVLDDNGFGVLIASDIGSVDTSIHAVISQTLADNGGPTLTHAIIGGSPAIDAGDANLFSGPNGVPEFDQRGTGFTRVVDGDGNGASAIDIGAFELQMPINSPPNFIPSILPPVREDSGPQLLNGFATFDPGSPQETSQNVVAYEVSDISNPDLFQMLPAIDRDGNLTYTPADDAFGTSTFDVSVQDDGGTADGGIDTSPVQRLTIQVTSVNDAPTFTANNPPAIDESAAGESVIVPGFVTSFDPGPDNESDQTVVGYSVFNVSNPEFFTAGPSVDIDGTLSYTVVGEVFGTVTFAVAVQDSGGTSDGGVDSSLALNFAITINENMGVADFGDAPSPYAVTLAQDGARHTFGGGLFLGATVDSELDGQPSIGAIGDGTDEDGVVRIADIVSVNGVETTSSFLINASQSGLLDAWIDFNGDGDWLDSGEQIATSMAVSGGANTLSYKVNNAVAGDTVARFRLSSAGGLGPSGPADDGEVEDHVVTILDGSMTPDVNVNLVDDAATILVANGQFLVRRDVTDLLGVPRSSLGNVEVFGTDAVDAITLDFSGGDMVPPGGLTLDGVGTGNRLLMVGGDSDLDLSVQGNVLNKNLPIINLGTDHTNVIRIDAASARNFALLDLPPLIIGGENDAIRFAEADAWRMGVTLVVNGRFRRTVINTVGVEQPVQTLFPHDWQNLVEVSDVNNSGDVTSGDALVIINELSRRQYSDQVTGLLFDPRTVSPWPDNYYDQNGDDKATALDALRVINQLARLSSAGGERESAVKLAAVDEMFAEQGSDKRRIVDQSDRALLPTGPKLHQAFDRRAASPSIVIEQQAESEDHSITVVQAIDELLTDIKHEYLPCLDGRD